MIKSPARLILLLCLSIAALICRAGIADDLSGSRPNFIVFLTDDQGWGDLGCYSHPIIESPNLDRFAGEGLRLMQCYSACSVCSPSRSSILTGRTPYRNGVWRWIPSGHQVHLRTSEITISSLLQERGYHTCHTGKWHLNGHFNDDRHPQPDDHGYDHWFATQNNAAPNHLNPVNFVRNREPVGALQGESAVLAVQEAINWLRGLGDSPEPFFLTVWTHEPHQPIESAPRFMEPYVDIEDEGIRQHHGNITQMDHAFGLLMDAVDELELRDNTLVIFTSDNGPEGQGDTGRTRGSTGGLRGRKRHTHEGGIRVPGIIRWPGHIEPGTVSDEPVIGSDIFPTICEIMDIPLPDDRTIDGSSMLNLFDGQPIHRVQPLYWRNHLAPEEYRVALRVGDWKIIGSDELTSFELYNITGDWQETTDLSEAHPERFQEMKARLIEHDRQVLEEGPDWWKDEPPRRPRRSARLDPGTDETGDFDVVKGGTVTAAGEGYHLQSAGECLALRELDAPITDQATLRLRYQSTQLDSNTRNALLCLGSAPTNAATIKIGTAIGMGQHVVFDGGWGNVGSRASQADSFEPLDEFELVVRIDLKRHQLTATIGDVELSASLPADLDELNYVGYYVKGTASNFTEVEILSVE